MIDRADPFFAAVFYYLLQDAGAQGRGQRRKYAKMATLDEIGQAKQRISERLARLDSDRAKLAEQLNELEIAERVLSRFGKGETGASRRRGRPAKAAPPASPGARQRPAQPPQALSLSEAALQAVQRHPEGLSAGDVLNFLSRELGMSVRPNHLGIALQRHRRAGRLDIRDQRWFPPQSAPKDATPAPT
jgi:hypothetical protein